MALKGENEDTKNRLTSRIILIASILLLGIYCIGLFLMRGKFLPNTTVNGVDYSGMTAEEADKKFHDAYKGRTLSISERGGSNESLNFDNIDYSIQTEQSFTDLQKSQNHFLWPIAYIQKPALTTVESFLYDSSKLYNSLNSLQAVSGEVAAPTDAEIVKTEDGFVLQPQTEGNLLNMDKFSESIKNAIQNRDLSIDLDAADCYQHPAVYENDENLNAQMSFIEAVENTELELNLEGGWYRSLTKETFLPWLVYSEGDFYIDDAQLADYVYNLADQYDTYKHEREFVTHDGDTVMVGGGDYDNYGYGLNQEESAAIIRDAIMSGESRTVDLSWDHLAKTRDDNGSDFGQTYIELSIDQQHMWFYVDGEVALETDVVTGTATETRATPPGCYMVLDMLVDHMMTGSYGSSYTNYVLSICMNGIAIHDSSWRDSYGGDIWLYSGSHGCINTPYSAMAELYNHPAMGYKVPVIIYDRYNTVPVIHNEEYIG